MELITKEMMEKICEDKGNHIAKTRFLVDHMEEVRKLYEGADVESMGVKFDDVYESMLISIYIRGYADALNDINANTDVIIENKEERHGY